MKNPLSKRILRELKSEFSKYAIIFVFLVAIIGFISGILVSSGSLRISYDEVLKNIILRTEILNFPKKQMLQQSILLKKRV